MTPSNNCISFIRQWEGFRDKAYQDAGGKWTIGYGSTKWKDGRNVVRGETITQADALDLLRWEVETKNNAIGPIKVNQNQLDALLSFVYNLGVGAFLKSTLRKKVLLNPSDKTIRDEFMKWVNVRIGAKLYPLEGLKKRRKAEADLYYSI